MTNGPVKFEAINNLTNQKNNPKTDAAPDEAQQAGKEGKTQFKDDDDDDDEDGFGSLFYRQDAVVHGRFLIPRVSS